MLRVRQTITPENGRFHTFLSGRYPQVYYSLSVAMMVKAISRGLENRSQDVNDWVANRYHLHAPDGVAEGTTNNWQIRQGCRGIHQHQKWSNCRLVCHRGTCGSTRSSSCLQDVSYPWFGCQLVDVNYLRGAYDVAQERWRPLHAKLPENPHNGNPILLVPRRYLRSLPSINSDDFWSFCFSTENETLRNEFGSDVTKKVSKKKIIALARRHPGFRNNYIDNVEKNGSQPYDADLDEKGLIRTYSESKAYCDSHPQVLQVLSQADFPPVIEKMVEAYRHFMEQQQGWKLLNGEKSAQIMFLGIVAHYCRANNIDISREADVQMRRLRARTSNLNWRCQVTNAKRVWFG